MRNCQEINQTKSSNLIWECFHIWNSSQKAKNSVKMTESKSSNVIWECFDIWNSGWKVKNRVEMTEPKSSNLSVNEKLSRNLPNQVQQLECEWEIVKKFTKPSPATWFESVLIYGIQVKKPKTLSKWRNPSPATWMWMRNCHEIYQTNSSNLIWNCFDMWNSGRKVKNRVEITEPKSSNLSVNEKLSRKLPNQVQQLEFEWEIVKKLTKPSPATWFESVFIYGIQVKKPKTLSKWRNPSPATWLWIKNSQEIYQTKSSNLIWKCFDMWNSCQGAENKVKMTEPKSSNLSVNEKLSRNLPNQVQQLECEWEIVKKFTKPSPATWFESVLIYGIQVKKPKTLSKWRNPSPATWMWMRNCHEIYQTNSSNLIWNCFDMWNSGRKVKNRVEITEPKSSNLSVNEKLSRKLPNQVQQLEFEWEIVKKLTKPSPATWFESVFIYGVQVKKPKTMLKWRNPSPATWLWIKNSQEIYQTKSSNLIWKCFDMWNSCQQAKNKVKMTEPKSSNLSVNEKLSRNLTNQVQQLECEWEIVKKFTKPSPATWFESVLIYGIQVKKPKTLSKWRNPSPATWMWMRNCLEIYQTNSSKLIWNCFDIWNSGRKVKNRVEMTKPKSSNLSVNKKLSKIDETKSSNLSVNVKLSRNLPNQVQQLECEWEIVKKLTKPSPATWFESVFIYGIQVKKPKIMLKWRNPSPATWLWMKNSQEMYQTKSSSLSLNEKLSRN